MSTTNTTTSLDGLFKTVYGDSVINLLPDFAILSRKVPFKPAEKIGQRFEIPVKLQYEGGFSYGASGDGAFALNAAVAGKIARAQVDASQIVLRSQIDYESAFKAVSGGKTAFQDATQALIENMMESFAKRQELAILYGQTGLGKITGSPVVSTNATVQLSAATWAPGIWVAMENSTFDCYNGSSKINTNAALTLVSVDLANSKVVFSGNSTDLGNLAAGYDLYFLGGYGKEMSGLDKIMTNTGSLFNIDASVYELWKSTSYAVGGAISMSKTLLAAAQAVPLGLKESTMCMLAAKRWANLNNDLAALRRSDESYKSSGFENGVSGITYHGVSGDVVIESHPFVKEGEGFLVPDKRLKRVGSTDITFKRPGSPDKFFKEIENAAGFELRAYSDQQIFLEAPSYAVKLTGITD